MGSPSALLPQLDTHCEHKLPTSCVLTSTHKCCACEDQRSHQASYTVYIDGYGLRPWAPRWINYCWPCKEYWDHRTGNGVIPCASTRIPEIPSQSRFLDRWMHFYHQYWRLREAGASASVIDTYQEPWRDVDPGRLPRTRDEIRLGYQRSQYEMMIDTQQQHELLQSRQDDQTPHISVDDAIDQLLDEVESDVDDDNVMPEPTSSDAAAFVQTTSPLTYDLDPEIANTANQSISGYPEPLGSRLREWPTRLLRILSDSNDEAADAGARSGLALNQDSETPRVRRRLSAALSENPNLQIEVGTLESTVPDVNNTHQMPELPDLTQHAAQSASSPILNLLEEDPTIPVPEAPVRLTRQQMLNLILSAEVERRAQLEFLETMLQNASEGRQLLSHVADNVDQFDVLQTSRFARSNQRLGLDSLPRPEAVPDEAMTIRLECGICLQQVANIACVPCGHVVMCEWCAQIQLPLRTGTNTGALQGRPTCPKCRESVKTRVKLFF